MKVHDWIDEDIRATGAIITESVKHQTTLQYR